MTETTQAKKLKVSCSIPGGIELQITREAGSTAFPGTRVTVPYGSPVAIPGGGTSHALVDAKFMEAWFSQNKNNEALKRCILVEDPDAPAPTDNVEKSDDGAGVEAGDGREKQTGNDGGAGQESKDVNADKSGGAFQKLTDVGISTGTEGRPVPSAVVVPGDLSKPGDKPKLNEVDTAKPADDPAPVPNDVQKPQESGTQEPTDKPADDPA